MVMELVTVAVWLSAAVIAAIPWVRPAWAARTAVGLGVLGTASAVILAVMEAAGGVQVGWFAVIASLFIAGLSVWIQRFSLAYLREDPRRRWFVVWVNVLSGASIGVVLAPTVLWFAAAWSGAGAALVLLLATHRSSRQARQGAARTAAALALGDLCLWIAVGILAFAAGGDPAWRDLGAVVARMPSAAVAVAGVLLALAAASRAAQVPFHRWLPVTLAAPTPVSAIMHAGVVNAAAFLVLRFVPAIAVGPAAMLVLAVCGAASVLAGAAAFLIRPDLKGRLVGSTTAQMGFMLVTLAVGAWGAAVFHLIGHGVYKATLFLRSGDQIDQKRRALAGPPPTPVPARRRLPLTVLAVLLPGAGVAAAFVLIGGTVGVSAVLLACYGWLSLAVLLHGVLVRRGWSRVLRAAAMPAAVVAACAYVLIVHGVDLLISSDLPAALAPLPGWVVLVPLGLTVSLALLRHRAAGYGWLTLLAAGPTPRLRPHRARRSTIPLATRSLEEIA